MRRATALTVGVLVLLAACSSNGSDDAEGDGSAESTSGSRIHVVSQNLLHGAACPPDSDACALPDRIDLFTGQLEDADCPELVGIQEANAGMVELIRMSVADVCDGGYEVVWDGSEGIDREVVLTRLAVLGSARTRLAGPLRSALWVRVASDVGVVDFVSTHLASGSDDRSCSTDLCPPPCEPDDMLNACQARQTVAFAEEMAAEDSVMIIGGDLNAAPGEPTTTIISAAGFTDTHRQAGEAECDAATGTQCTSGRDDTSVAVLRDPASINTARIDFLWWGGDRTCDSVAPTGMLNAEPAVDGPGGLAFPADHTGVQATLECTTTDRHREDAARATVPDTTTTTRATSADAGAEATAGIAAAYEAFFDGAEPDFGVRVSHLEDGAELRPVVEDIFGRTAELASRSTGRVDSVTLTGPDSADVTYSVLIDGQVALSGVAGNAVRVSGEWLVGRDTFCSVATQGAAGIPEPCR